MKSLLVLLTFLSLLSCQSGADQPIEIDTVTYAPTLSEALTKSQKSGKPIFLLFQEVPG